LIHRDDNVHSTQHAIRTPHAAQNIQCLALACTTTPLAVNREIMAAASSSSGQTREGRPSQAEQQQSNAAAWYGFIRRMLQHFAALVGDEWLRTVLANTPIGVQEIENFVQALKIWTYSAGGDLRGKFSYLYPMYQTIQHVQHSLLGIDLEARKKHLPSVIPVMIVSDSTLNLGKKSKKHIHSPIDEIKQIIEDDHFVFDHHDIINGGTLNCLSDSLLRGMRNFENRKRLAAGLTFCQDDDIPFFDGIIIAYWNCNDICQSKGKKKKNKDVIDQLPPTMLENMQKFVDVLSRARCMHHRSRKLQDLGHGQLLRRHGTPIATARPQSGGRPSRGCK